MKTSRLVMAAAAITFVSAGLVGCQNSNVNDVSNDAILHDLTPDLVTLSRRKGEVHKDFHVSADQNKRMFWDDLNRAFYTDTPSRLSPWAVVNTTGQPR